MARTTAMSVRLEPETRDLLDTFAKRADTAPSTLAADLIEAGLKESFPGSGVLAPTCDMCKVVAARFADADPMQRWLVEFLEGMVVHSGDDVAGAIAAPRLLDELRATSDD